MTATSGSYLARLLMDPFEVADQLIPDITTVGRSSTYSAQDRWC